MDIQTYRLGTLTFLANKIAGLRLTDDDLNAFSVDLQSKFAAPGAAGLPAWTTSTRPNTPAIGATGYNTTIPALEVWTGAAWAALAFATTAPPQSAAIAGTAPSGTVGTPYSYSFSTSNFSGAITATVGSGSLPAGLSLSVSGTNIVLSGTPTSAATSTFTIHAAGATSGTADSASQSVAISAATVSMRARFAQDTATAGANNAAALFASMTQVSGASSNRNGTMTTTADQAKYTWVAVLASASGSGMRFFDGTGYGGFNGAQSSSIYSGPDADPTTVCQTYTDSSGNAWNLYRSSGHSVALTFTLS